MAKLEAIRAKKAGKAAGGDDDDGRLARGQGEGAAGDDRFRARLARFWRGCSGHLRPSEECRQVRNAVHVGWRRWRGVERARRGEAAAWWTRGGAAAATGSEEAESPPPPPSALRRQSTGHLRSADATAKLAAIQARKNSRKNLVKDEDEFGETEAMAKGHRQVQLLGDAPGNLSEVCGRGVMSVE